MTKFENIGNSFKDLKGLKSQFSEGPKPKDLGAAAVKKEKREDKTNKNEAEKAAILEQSRLRKKEFGEKVNEYTDAIKEILSVKDGLPEKSHSSYQHILQEVSRLEKEMVSYENKANSAKNEKAKEIYRQKAEYFKKEFNEAKATREKIKNKFKNQKENKSSVVETDEQQKKEIVKERPYIGENKIEKENEFIKETKKIEKKLEEKWDIGGAKSENKKNEEHLGLFNDKDKAEEKEIKEDIRPQIQADIVKEKMEMARKASEITLARIDNHQKYNYQELWAETKQKGDEKFLKKTRELWKEFAISGVIGKEKKTGKNIILNYTDLDGRASLGLLNLAGINTKDIKYVAPGEFVPG